MKLVVHALVIIYDKLFLENVSGQILLIVLLMVGLRSDKLTDLNLKCRELIKMVPSLLIVREISLFKF